MPIDMEYFLTLTNQCHRIGVGQQKDQVIWQMWQAWMKI